MGMIAFHGKQAIKNKYVRRVEAHRKADELVQGIGWESNGVTRGCGIGCTFNAYDHSRGPIEIGVPTVLMRLEDSIFEGLPRADALLWPTRFLKAIKPGADLSLVWTRFVVWLLIDPQCGVIRFVGNHPDVRNAIERVAELWQRVIDGENVESLRSDFAADAAAAAARWSAAAAAAAAAAADAARWSAAAAARWSAAAAAAAADDADAVARKVHWKACANKCIELIEDCKPASRSTP